MQARSTLQNLRMSARKVRLVADMVRGMHVEQAINTLSFVKQAAGVPVKKVIESALANAENNEGLDVDTLFLGEIRVDEGPTIKRFRPRARGRACPIRKRTSHISVVLEAR